MEDTMPLNKNNFCLKNIEDFPVKEAIQAQEKLIDLAEKGGLLEWFKSKYCNQPLKKNGFIAYLLNNWETLGKDIIIEYTGIEVYESIDIYAETEIKERVDTQKLTYGSNKKLIWFCSKCQQPYTLGVKQRLRGRSCVSCSLKQRAIKRALPKEGESLLDYCNTHGNFGDKLRKEYTGIEVDKEWTHIINKDIPIDRIRYASNKYMLWDCLKCHKKFRQQVYHRTFGQNNCPYCSFVSTSLPERYIYKALSQVISGTENRKKMFKELRSNGYEYDIYIPIKEGFKGVLIEYSGETWHANIKEKDKIKRELAEKNGYKFIEIIEYTTHNRLKENGKFIDTYSNQYKYDRFTHLQEVVMEIFREINREELYKLIDFKSVYEQALNDY